MQEKRVTDKIMPTLKHRGHSLLAFIVVLLLVLGISSYVSKRAYALNQIANWAFTGNSTGWSSTSGTGTNTCGTTTSTSGTGFSPFSYGNNDWTATTSAGTTLNRGMLFQTFTVPGTGTVKISGSLDYSALAASGGSWTTGWTRLDIYNSSNTTHLANLACESYTTNQNLHTTAIGTYDATGGTTYTVRVSIGAQSANSKKIITTTIDNVIISTAPVGVSVSAPTGTSSALLNWTASSGGSGAPALHSTNPYKIYRSTSTPVTTANYLASSTTNSYTDTSTTGNTRYYYAVTNVDTNNFESPLSNEVTILTRPGSPGTPTYTNIQFTTLTVNWTAPPGGASTYNVERCTGSGCSNFSQVSSGVSATSYNDSNLTLGTSYRYRVIAVNATGTGAASADSPVTTSATISVALETDGTVNYAVMLPGASKSTLDLSDTQTVRNDGNVTETFYIKTSATSGGNVWNLGSEPGSDTYVHQYSVNGGSSWNLFNEPDAYSVLSSGVTPSATRNFDLKLTVPNSTSDFQQKNVFVTILAVQE